MTFLFSAEKILTQIKSKEGEKKKQSTQSKYYVAPSVCVSSQHWQCARPFTVIVSEAARRSWIMNVFGRVCAVAGVSEPPGRSGFTVILLRVFSPTYGKFSFVFHLLCIILQELCRRESGADSLPFGPVGGQLDAGGRESSGSAHAQRRCWAQPPRWAFQSLNARFHP